MALPFGPISPLIDKHHVALGKIGGTKMNFRSLTQMFNRTRSAPLTYEECPSIDMKKILIVDGGARPNPPLYPALRVSDRVPPRKKFAQGFVGR